MVEATAHTIEKDGPLPAPLEDDEPISRSTKAMLGRGGIGDPTSGTPRQRCKPLRVDGLFV